ncbi:polysaccharide deacetylase family protein [Halobacteria archaeon AArc-curdl1]|uniref:Polysaccharide deacetylase family protein n=1 Tax=Natronosalvus hydrolyticus TaxID=2979988 RepID=A0AAP2ZB54_9EURY|nr:polysaccharide deacetylase family protein [Halobacteria archaeon AArc-curdl1]
MSRSDPQGEFPQPDDVENASVLAATSTSNEELIASEYDGRNSLRKDSSSDTIKPRFNPEDNLACITLDLENDWYFDESGYDHLTFEYIDDYIELIQELDIPVTFFVVGRTLEQFPDVIDTLDAELDCEFHLHSYQHDTSKDYDFRTEVRRGIDAFENHFGHRPIGYRAPQGNIEPHEFEILKNEGFAFDSSIFPSYRPGVYSNLDKPLTPYRPKGTNELLEIPLGATPRTRIPLSHSYLKLIGWPFQSYLRRASLPPLVVYNTHLQDLYRTDSHEKLDQLKGFLFKRNMDRSEELFRWSVSLLRDRGYSFGTMTEAYEAYKESSGIELAYDESDVGSRATMGEAEVDAKNGSEPLHSKESGNI